MQGDVRYKIIKPRFNEGKIKRFGDIVKIVRKSVLAADLGKNGDRFNRILDHTEEFTIHELVLIGRLCNLSLPEMLTLVGHDYSGKIPKGKRDDRYDYIRTMYNEGEITSFEQIFEIVPRYIVAKDLRTKRQRLGKLINQIEKFSIKELISIGKLCYLNTNEIFSLVAATYANQTNKKKKNVRA
jgi:hypothetical protein